MSNINNHQSYMTRREFEHNLYWYDANQDGKIDDEDLRLLKNNPKLRALLAADADGVIDANDVDKRGGEDSPYLTAKEFEHHLYWLDANKDGQLDERDLALLDKTSGLFGYHQKCVLRSLLATDKDGVINAKDVIKRGGNRSASAYSPAAQPNAAPAQPTNNNSSNGASTTSNSSQTQYVRTNADKLADLREKVAQVNVQRADQPVTLENMRNKNTNASANTNNTSTSSTGSSNADPNFQAGLKALSSANDKVKQLWDKYNSTEDDKEKQKIMLELQRAQQQEQQIYQFLTNMLKAQHQTIMSIIRNLA
jgi:hypothetical protein